MAIEFSNSDDLERELGISSQQFFAALYIAFLLRRAVEQEHEYYVRALNSGVPLFQLVTAISDSPEAERVRMRDSKAQAAYCMPSHHGLYAEFALSDSSVVALFGILYSALLGREGAADELHNYVSAVESGVPVLDLVATVCGSPEAASARRVRLAPDEAGLDDALSSEHCDEPELSLVVDPSVPIKTTVPVGLADLIAVISHIYAVVGKTPAHDDILRKAKAVLSVGDLKALIDDLPVELGHAETPDSVAYVVRILYQEILKRPVSDEEIAPWYQYYISKKSISSIVAEINNSAEAQMRRRPDIPAEIEGVAPGTLVQMAYEIILGRGAAASEVDAFRVRIERSGLLIDDIVKSFFQDALARRLKGRESDAVNDPDLAYLFGSRGVVNSKVWAEPNVQTSRVPDLPVLGGSSLLQMKRRKTVTVSIITSLYKGGPYIREFLENIVSQTIFKSHCELIIIDAASPDGEREVIEKFQKEHPGIIYRRMESRIGIYEAWNVGISMSKGCYLTNANLDDSRKHNSLEIQAAVLDTLPFVDITYQDVLYSFEQHAPFSHIQSKNLSSLLPVISHYNIMEFNSPHNGPMWRRTLHDEIGFFNEDYKSAADFDFWIRCLIAGKTFYKTNEPHVAYYVNPEGLSTRADTRGVMESNDISRKKYRRIISPLLVAKEADFLAAIGSEQSPEESSFRRYDTVQAALVAFGCGGK